MDASVATVATVRDYEPADLPAVTRVWREVGWIDSDRQKEALGHLLSGGAAQVAVVDGAAECLVHRTPGTIRYDDADLPLCAITAVTTSAIARNLGLASRLTAAAIVSGVHEGAAVAALGMFEQGFYDRFGLGTLGYVHQLRFDPADLRVPPPRRRPVRLTRGDWEEIAGLLARRARRHGAVTLESPHNVRADLAWVDDPFVGLGFRDDGGRLTGCVAGSRTGEHGPLKIELFAYEAADDLRDLLGLLHSLSAQIHQVVLPEPAGLQLQDLLTHPIRGTDLLDADRRPWHEAMAWYQARILDLDRCVTARRWPGPPVPFDLTLTDPLAGATDTSGRAWPGLGGDHSVTVGDPSTVVPGHRGGLPVLRASVGAFSRLWFGVQRATGLAVTDDLDGPPELLAALDRALLLPSPIPGLAF